MRLLLVSLLVPLACGVGQPLEEIEVGDAGAAGLCAAPPEVRQNTNLNLVLGYPLALSARIVNTRTTPAVVTVKVVGAGGGCTVGTPSALLQVVSIGFDDPYVSSAEGTCPQVAISLLPGGDAYVYLMVSYVADVYDPVQLQIRFP